MQYNTKMNRLPMPEYGRSVQNMVDHALTIEDRAERQRCANTIIKIMGNMYPLMRDLPDFKQKLWDHLAIMSDFKLDIDYPCEVVQAETLQVRPERIPYPTGRIRYRHYGRILEQLIKQAMEYPEGEEKKELLHLIAIQMRKDFVTWNKDAVEVDKIIDDVLEYSDGKIRLTASDLEFNSLELKQAETKRPVNVQQKRRAKKKTN
ncbi:MAG: DUF4290 domain-containing protein [Bacteroidaceae bacterium]|nr:DUF4290 domain-containing protein [Bacteroidaceae bacterium]